MKKEISTRQLKVGEQIKHILSDIFVKNDFHNEVIATSSVSISEVRVSPDLKNSTVYVLSLLSNDLESVVQELNSISSKIRRLLSEELSMKFVPAVHFAVDDAFFEAKKVDTILKSDRVVKDLVS